MEGQSACADCPSMLVGDAIMMNVESHYYVF